MKRHFQRRKESLPRYERLTVPSTILQRQMYMYGAMGKESKRHLNAPTFIKRNQLYYLRPSSTIRSTSLLQYTIRTQSVPTRLFTLQLYVLQYSSMHKRHEHLLQHMQECSETHPTQAVMRPLHICALLSNPRCRSFRNQYCHSSTVQYSVATLYRYCMPHLYCTMHCIALHTDVLYCIIYCTSLYSTL